MQFVYKYSDVFLRTELFNEIEAYHNDIRTISCMCSRICGTCKILRDLPYTAGRDSISGKNERR